MRYIYKYHEMDLATLKAIWKYHRFELNYTQLKEIRKAIKSKKESQ